MVIEGKELRPIPGWEDSYWISSKGDIWSLKSKKWLKAHPIGASRQCLGVRLFRNNVGYSYRLHRLVAEVWVNNPDGLKNVNHKDGDHKNNDADNLEWINTKEDLAYKEANKRRSEAKRGKPRNTKVRCVETGEEWDSIAKCARDTGYSYSNLKSCVKGLHETVRGYHFVRV